MARTTPALAIAALKQDVVKTFWLVELYFDSATGYYTNLPFESGFLYNGNTYIPDRGLGSVSNLSESEGQAGGMVLTLAGVTEAHIAGLLTEPVQGRKAIVRMAILDNSVQPPVARVDDVIYSGLMDVQIFDEQQASISVTLESRFIEWDKPNLFRFTDEDQRQRYVGDGFLKHIASMESKQIIVFSKEALRAAS